jgi:spore maturation protein SpmA
MFDVLAWYGGKNLASFTLLSPFAVAEIRRKQAASFTMDVFFSIYASTSSIL